MNTSEGEDELQEWIFTFGYGQWNGVRKNNFVRIRGTFLEAREEMIRRYGRQWSMQYPSTEAAGVHEYNLRELKDE